MTGGGAAAVPHWRCVHVAQSPPFVLRCCRRAKATGRGHVIGARGGRAAFVPSHQGMEAASLHNVGMFNGGRRALGEQQCLAQ